MNPETKLSLADKVKAAAAAGAAKAKEDAGKVPTPRRVEGYKANHVKRLVLKNGTIVLPVDGVFIPKSQEEYDYLEHLAASTISSLERITSDEDSKE